MTYRRDALVAVAVISAALIVSLRLFGSHLVDGIAQNDLTMHPKDARVADATDTDTSGPSLSTDRPGGGMEQSDDELRRMIADVRSTASSKRDCLFELLSRNISPANVLPDLRQVVGRSDWVKSARWTDVTHASLLPRWVQGPQSHIVLSWSHPALADTQSGFLISFRLSNSTLGDPWALTVSKAIAELTGATSDRKLVVDGVAFVKNFGLSDQELWGTGAAEPRHK
jgi:hypothetical protein